MIDEHDIAVIGVGRAIGEAAEPSDLLRRHGVQVTAQRLAVLRAVADLLNGVDKEMSKNLLARLEERNAHLGAHPME